VSVSLVFTLLLVAGIVVAGIGALVALVLVLLRTGRTTSQD
jgi:hypothetical protein